MPLNDWEVSYAGLTFGGDTDYSLIEIDGLLSLPDVVSADHGQLRQNGEYPGESFMMTRTITILMDLVAHNEEDFTNLVAQARGISYPLRVESDLVMKIPSAFSGEEVFFSARPMRRRLPIDLGYKYRNTTAQIQFKATYPFARSTTEQTAAMVLASASGGRTYPRTYNRTYGATSTGGSALLQNSGNADADSVLTFVGPLTRPKATLLDTGEFMEFDITLSAGQQLIVDTRSKTVLLEGTASRRSTLVTGSKFWKIPPTISGSSVNFSAQLFEAGTLSISHRSTYA